MSDTIIAVLMLCITLLIIKGVEYAKDIYTAWVVNKLIKDDGLEEED